MIRQIWQVVQRLQVVRLPDEIPVDEVRVLPQPRGRVLCKVGSASTSAQVQWSIAFNPQLKRSPR